MGGILGGILLGSLLTAINAGMSALGDASLQAIEEAGKKDAKIATRILAQRSTIRARLLVARVFCVTFAAGLAGYALLKNEGLGAALVALAIVALVYSLVATLTTTIARQRPRRTTLFLLRWTRPLEWLVAPLAAPLDVLATMIAKAIPEQGEENSARAAELAVEHIIDASEETGSIAKDQAAMLRSVLEFKNTVAREIMVPRTQLVAFALDTPVLEVVDTITKFGHSRYPVFRDHIDQIEGVLYAKDLFAHLQNADPESPIKLEALLRKPVIVAPETRKIGMLLREMQARKSHLVVVVDEFGGASGIVTLEDVVEEIVGDIQDEHDEEVPLVRAAGPDRYFVETSVSVHDLEDAIDESICDDKEGFDTLGGWLVQIAGRVPKAGDALQAGPYEVVILQADDRRITRVEMNRVGDPSEEKDDADAKLAAG